MNTNHLKVMLKLDEGPGPMINGRHMMYKDSVDLWTVGFGRNIQERGLSPEEAEFLLDNDIIDAIKECHSFDWFNNLDDVRQTVVVDMVYNMGLPRFSGFKKTIKLISDHRFEEAASEMMDSKWARQVGVRAVRLSQMMSSGEYNV